MPTNKRKKEQEELAVSEGNAVSEGIASAQPEGELSDEELVSVEATEAFVNIVTLEKERDEAHKIAAEYLDGWQRSMAEFSNYKKRVERDREQVQQTLTGTIVKRYLEILDDLERAMKSRPIDGDGAAWADGIELVYRKLLIILDSQEVRPMDALGQPFDPNRHEAIGHMESSVYPSGHIAEVVQNGYLIGDRVLRPALVRIVN
jgi:molecular chaperone GrpE